MLFLELYTLPNATTPDAIFSQTITQVPSLVPLLFAFIFFVVFIGGIVRQYTKVGGADYSMWAVIASISTLIIALLLSITAGYIHADWLIVIVVITIFSGLWFFLDKSGRGI